MGTHTFIRDLDVGEFNQLDGRRVEVIADGLLGHRHHTRVTIAR